MKQRYATYASELSTLGYDTTPLKGKVPILKAWQTRPAHEHSQYGNSNIGILCGGAHNIVAVDIDVKDKETSELIKQMVIDQLGFAPERIGNAPKTLFVFKCSEPFYKVKTGIYEIDGQDAAVEVLAEGQQFVASGPHPDTKQNYKWPDDSLMDIPPLQLTEINPSDISAFIASCNNALAEHGEIKAKSMSGGKKQENFNYAFAEESKMADLKKIDLAVAHIDNDDLHYDDWVYISHAIKGSVGDEGLELFHRWSKRSSKYDATECDRLWHSIGDVATIGAGTIFHMAMQNGYTHQDDTFGPADHEKGQDEEFGDTEASTDDGSFTASSVVGPLPDREWLLDQWFPYKATALFFGAGGVGKSLLIQQFANCVAMGEEFFGIATKQMPVLTVMCEDDALELKRRQLDINKWLGVAEFDSGPTDLTLWPRVGSDNILVTFPNQGEDKAGDFYEILCNKIKEVRGDREDILVILDTAADMFGGGENVRREVNTFCKTYLGSFTKQFNATVILLAHPSLSGLASGSGLSGSTAWENSVRSRAYLERVADSDELRVLSRKKSNYSDIGGDNDITLIWDDGVLVIPSSESQLDRISSKQLKEKILSEVEAAWCAKTPYKSNKSNGRTVKTALPKAFPDEKKGKILKTFNDLIDDGNIVHVDRKGYRVEIWLNKA
tara:strand:- start:818 stop:2821 length:2004 start_codon:yes stop_codon:yes gene_type:complete